MSALLLIVTFMIMYFLPALEAHRRNHRNAVAICALNALLGWTILGWIVALVWALTDNTKGEVKYG